MKVIPLTKGQVAKVDDEDYERLVSLGKWTARISTENFSMNNQRLKGFLFLSLLFFTFSAQAAVRIQGGGGGTATIAAGATNGIAMLNGGGTNTTLLDPTFNGLAKATNGNIQLLNDGFWMVFGPPLGEGAAIITNNAGTYQNGQFIMNQSGQSIEVSGGAFQSIKTGSTMRFESGAVLDMDNLLTNALLRVGSGGIISTQTLGSGLSMSAAGVLSATGSGTPGGAEAMLQVNMGGSFVGSTNITANVTNGTLMIGTTTAKTNLTVHNAGNAAGISVSSDQGLGNTNQFDTAGIRSSSGGLAFDLWNSISAYNMSTNDFSPGFTVKQRLGLTTKYWYEAYIAQLNATNIYGAGTLHTAGGITGSTLTSSNALGAPSYTRWYETNGTFSHTIQAATRMARSSTNIPGVFEAAAATVQELNLRQQQSLDVTNRAGQNLTLVVTNGVPGDLYSAVLIGALAGGTDYTCSLVVHTGQLARNLDGTNNAPALSISIPVPAGSTVEINGRVRFGVGTNWHDVVTRKGLGS